jgi:flagellar assembly protein FliH
MSTGTSSSEMRSEAMDSALAEEAQKGRLDDNEIQRLVMLSRDAAYQRSEHVPVKTVEVFEPRSLVSIAMDAQRRREAEMRTAVAAGAMIDPDLANEGEAAEAAAADHQSQDMAPSQNAAAEAEAGAASQADGAMPAGEDAAASDTPEEGAADEESAQDSAQESPQGSTPGASQIDFEAGRAAGLEEGHATGFEEGHAKGLEEGRAAGRAEASAQLERAIQAFEIAAEKLGNLTEIDSNALGESIHKAILTLASERAGRAIAEQPDAFADRIEGLLAAIRTASGQPVIHLNPGDLGSVQPLVETREKLRHCAFVASADLAAGDLSVTVGTIGIDDIILPAVQEPAASSTPANAAVKSEVNQLEVNQPEVNAPEVNAPETSGPETSGPEMTGPETPYGAEQRPEGKVAGGTEAGKDIDTDIATDTLQGESDD